METVSSTQLFPANIYAVGTILNFQPFSLNCLGNYIPVLILQEFNTEAI